MSSKKKTDPQEQPGGSVPERPTDEALAKGEFREEPVSVAPGAKTRMRRVDGSEIDRLYLKGRLTQDEHTTLMAFYGDMTKAGLVFCPRAGIIPASTAGSAQFISDGAFRRAARMKGRMVDLQDALGRHDLSLLLSMLNMDQPMPKGKECIPAKAAQVLIPHYSRR